MSKLTRREKRQLDKEKRLRRKVERNKRKEYSKEYLKKMDSRGEVPHTLPVFKRVLLFDFLRSTDLRKSLALFIGSQLSIMFILLGVDSTNYGGSFSAAAIIISLISIGYGIKEINRRQSIDITRKPVDYGLVLKVLVSAIVFISIFNIAIYSPEAAETIQPNQEVINNTLKTFPLTMIFITVIAAPIIEEVIFRELLPTATGPSYFSFILTSILFILVHSPNGFVGWVSYGTVTVAILYARLKNNNVYTGILVHLLWNLLSIFL